MRRSTLLGFLMVLIAFGVYFRVIDPMLESNRWLAFLLFMLISVAGSSLNKAIEGRFEFLDKRLDPQMSVWLAAGLLIFLPLLIVSLG
ncbi:hypothetical protein [Planococcus shenhongbingii]|uniref:Uncharacterized protein n=1 Tax=Planococcus shenhongbingii TaxID=3058398 RepID=A0ABT8NCQ1_9BACL|nr:hypothetical protein [Planococcus sp. N017]MDN7245672.1 hypothetical protein [Planococcus sp. N017]